MGLGKKVLVIGLPFDGKSALMSAMTQLLIVEASKKSGVIVIHDSVMSPQEVKDKIDAVEEYTKEEVIPKKTLVIKPYHLEPLPQPFRYFEQDSNPWPGRKGSNKKHWNTTKHKKRL